MDGTLTETNQLIYDSFNYIAKKYSGKTYSIPEIHAMFGPPEEEALLAIVNEEKIDEVMKEYLDFYLSNHSRLARLYPGIEKILSYTKERGRKLALFTGKGIHTTEITLEEFHIKKYFDLIITGNDVVNRKPSAEGLHKIMDYFSLQPDEVLMVGDAVSDIKASHDAGINIAAVIWDSYSKDDVLRMETDFVFYNIEEFYEWLRKQFD